ncbi:GTP-binding protein [Streptomyces sp. F63]|uniref:CobW family GTP-binding protein n=1 Tax=Streptomyces sp. F63 TaxID=2824887 RepID=UPI001B363B67|nr:GTP-binding protein [Streptomyces sp. F63]MBQ0985511.1 GTP-binding protein [Streptomyces sp. F63]
MARRQIPVVVLAGFLGSGKTTLLNHLLSSSDGTRVGAVVNDFGRIEIDAMALAGQVDSMVSLGNGCLCCAVDTSELDGFLERLARPGAGIDVIVIEASGLAEPQELIRMILASDNERIVYGGLVEVVDAAEFTRTRTAHPELDRHVGIADLVVLNKADRVDEAGLRDTLDTLQRLAPRAPVIPAAHGRIDAGLLFDARPRAQETEAVRQLSFEDLYREMHRERETCGHTGRDGGCHDGCAGRGHFHSAYDSVEFTSGTPLDPRRLMAFLDSRPDGLYRIKGWVHFGADGHREQFTLHAVGDFLRFYPSPWARDETPGTQLVLIGTGIDAGAVRKELEACRETAPGEAAADETGMWGVLRYTWRDRPEEPEEPEEPPGAYGEPGAYGPEPEDAAES